MYEKQTFGQRLPTLHEFIPAISRAIDTQFGGRQRLVENKRIRYFHTDKMIRKALEDASWELNPVGMKTFYDTILLFEKRNSSLWRKTVKSKKNMNREKNLTKQMVKLAHALLMDRICSVDMLFFTARSSIFLCLILRICIMHC
jgi:hypothetical protein